MAVWHEHQCILVLEPNATLIFSLASLQLSPQCLCHSQADCCLSLSGSFQHLHANLKSAAFCEEKNCVKTLLAGKTDPEMGHSAPSDHD